MSQKTIVLLAVSIGLAACTPQPPPRDPVVVRQPSDPASLRSALSGLGFTIDDSATEMTATMAVGPKDPRAICRSIYLRDNFGERVSRGRFVDPDGVIITAAATETGELRVTALGSYLNRFDNRRTTDACDVSADFEAQIRNALEEA